MAVEVARHFNTAIRWSFKMEMDMVAVQRLMRYATLPPEQSKELLNKQQDRLEGNIEFKKVEMRYQVHLEPALKNLSLKIAAGEKIAVVGRTGAGKSSFFQLLQGFRQSCDGEILVDGKNLQTYSKR